MIFTLFITCIFGLGALQPSCAAPRPNEIQVVESKRKNNLLVETDYCAVSYLELLTRNELYSTFTDAFKFAETINYQYSIDFSYNARILTWMYMTPNNLSYAYSIAVGIDELTFKLTRFAYSSEVQSACYQEWTATLYDDNRDTYVYNIEVSYIQDLHVPSARNMIGVSFISAGNSSGDLSSYLIFDSYSLIYEKMVSDRYQEGYQRGYYEGNENGFSEGYEQGEIHGKDIAQDPSSEIYQNTYDTGYNAGQQAGYSVGYSDASADSGVPATIFSGILSVALIPVNVFIQMFQYEVFGINIAGLVSALITIAMVIIIVRFLLGGKTDDK